MSYWTGVGAGRFRFCQQTNRNFLKSLRGSLAMGKPSDFWHGTIIPDDYSAKIKAVELVSGCKVIRDTFATTGRPASVVMGVGCEE